MEAELASIEEKIEDREGRLAELRPEWEALRAREIDEKRHLDEAQGRLDALFAKRGRLDRFRTRADRDRYMRAEIASVEAYSVGQNDALATTRSNLEQAHTSLREIEDQLETAEESQEDARGRTKQLAEQLAGLKDEHAELTEKRKDLWREETKLKSLVDSEADELRSAERSLASMMDKVSTGLTRKNVI